MKELQLRTSERTVPIFVGKNIYDQALSEVCRRGLRESPRFVVITDSNVRRLNMCQSLLESLRRAGEVLSVLEMQSGDAYKTLSTVTRMYQSLSELKLRRSDVIVAFGGGAVGDLAGFVASTYLRGVRFIQVPTTLLAHDSSIGGKVGVNLDSGKNLVGSFYQPVAVIYDLEALDTLPVGEWKSGMAEVIKHGAIGDENLLNRLGSSPLFQSSSADAVDVIADAMAVKIKIVENDERENGVRMLLNAGHTIGHALELLSNYELPHGVAVALGLVAESELAVRMNLLAETKLRQLQHVLSLYGLGYGFPSLRWEDIQTAVHMDKKHRTSGWTFALLTDLGSASVVHDVPLSLVQEAYENVVKEDGAQ